MSNIFQIYTDISFLPVDEHEAYLEEGISGVCTGGTAIVEVSSFPCKIARNDLVTILPLQLASIREVSHDFSMTFFLVDKVMFTDLMSGLAKITPDFFFYMRKNFRYHLSDRDVKRFLGFCRVLDFRCSNDDSIFRKETILHLLRIYYWDHYTVFQKIKAGKNPLPNTNKENIALRFAMLVFEHHETHREIAFYADKLCISPLYLTKVIQEVYGQSAHEMITTHVVVGIKSKLRDANIGIKDIVRQIGFANQSSLSRFFRQHTGMSPSEYRRTIHFM